jgi:Fe/S biogenesis protein NfuA
MSKPIEITTRAQDYLADLLVKQDADNIGVRVFVQQPGTPYAETCLAYCRPGEEQETDTLVEGMPFPAYLDQPSLAFLDDAVIDFAEDKMGGQLTIKAPNSKLPKVHEDSPLEEKISYYLWTEVNPMLAAHGGEVSLLEIIEENVAILKFGGGCQGCSAVDMTLKEGVQKTLMERIPELGGVKDATDHTDKSQAYY